MGFPAGMQLATIAFGIPLTATGKEVVTNVTVKPTARLIWAATGQPLPEFEDSFTAEAGQLGQFQVPFVDQPGFIDSLGNAVTDFAYQVTASWQFGNARPITWSKNLKPLLGQTGPIDLDLVPDGPVSIPVTAPTAAVLGFNGRTGFITLQDSDLPARLSDAQLTATYASKEIEPRTSGKKAVGQGELIVNVKDRGAKGDAKRFNSGAAITSGSTALTVTAASFTAGDVGKLLYIVGAGAAGAVLSTTITAVTDATHATLAASAGTTVANAAYLYGTDDTAAIQAVLDGVNDDAVSYTQVFFPKGNYLTGGLLVKNNTHLIGAGRGAWAYEFYDRTTRLIAKPGMTAAGLITDYTGQQVGNIRITDMMLDGAKAFHSVAKTGVYLTDSGLSADSLWSLERVYIGFFSGDGAYLGAYRRANRFNDCHIWQCAGNGIVVAGSDNSFIQSMFASCGGDGVSVTQSTNHFYGCDIFNNTGHGVNVSQLGRMTMLTNCSIDTNGKSGVYNDAKNLSLVQCRFASNSQSADGVYPDIDLANGREGVVITNPIFYVMTGVTNLPHSGLRAVGNNISNNVLLSGFSFDPSATTWRSGSYVDSQVAVLHKGFNLNDGAVINTSTGSGAKIGGSATQKLGFYGATAIVRPTKPANATDLASAITAVNDLIAKLSASGGGVGLIS